MFFDNIDIPYLYYLNEQMEHICYILLLKGNDYIMTSENVQTLINNYFEYLSPSTESEGDATSAMESISVVRKSDDAIYQMIGITSDVQSEEKILKFKSLNPIMKQYNGIAGSSMEYDYCDISESDFDEKFYTYEEWQHVLLKIIVTEMNKEIFKFLQPYFIISKQNWSFQLSCNGTRMGLQFWGYGAYKYEKLEIYVEKINKAHITLYGNGDNKSITILDYDNDIVTINPASYGSLGEADMEKLCNKVAKIMRTNPINKRKECEIK